MDYLVPVPRYLLYTCSMVGEIIVLCLLLRESHVVRTFQQ